MPNKQKLPVVYRRKRVYPNGEVKYSSTYYFKATANGKRTDINTGKTLEAEAIQDMKAWFKKREQTANTEFIKAEPQDETIVEVMRLEGWLTAGTNPKYDIGKRNKNKNFGYTQAKKIADALTHIFIEIQDIEDFGYFLKDYKILKNATLDDYKNFIAKPIRALTKKDANRFLQFLYEYSIWERKENRKPKDKYFICQHRMNVIALKSFYSYITKMQIVENNIFAGSDIPVNMKEAQKKKEKFTITQLRAIFKDENIKKIMNVDTLPSEYYALKFSALTGMRSGEVRALRWKQISLDSRIVEVNSAFKRDSTKTDYIGKPKWEIERTVVLCDSATACLGERESPESFVFQLRNGNAIGSRKYITWLEQHLDRIDNYLIAGNQPTITGGKHYTPHSFRGSLNTLLTNLPDINNALVQQYFGWTQEYLTPVQKTNYTKFIVEGMWIVANQIELLYSGKPMTWKPQIATTEPDFSEILDDLIRKDIKPQGFLQSLEKQTHEIGTFKYAEETLKQKFDEDDSFSVN